MDKKNTDYYYNVIRKNIRKYRRLNNLTQEELGEKIGSTYKYISKIESGTIKVNYSFDIICKIAIALNIEVIDLLKE